MTEEPLPAWSLPAEAVERIELGGAWPGEVTREGAWGCATGAGVRVCVLDSGVEAGHPLQRLVDQRIVAPGLDPADLAQHGGSVAAPGAGDCADRQAGGGMSEVGDGAIRHPPRDHAAPPDATR